MPDLYKVTRTMTFTGTVRAESLEEARTRADNLSDVMMKYVDSRNDVEIIPCEHQRADMKSEVIVSGEWCPKCGMLYP